MVKRASEAEDWQTTQIPAVCYSPSLHIYYIEHLSTDPSVLERHQITRHHGAEKDDTPEAEGILSQLPPTLWTDGPFDVGCCKMDSVHFAIPVNCLVSVSQYKLLPEATEGIADTSQGLPQAGVIRQTKFN